MQRWMKTKTVSTKAFWRKFWDLPKDGRIATRGAYRKWVQDPFGSGQDFHRIQKFQGEQVWSLDIAHNDFRAFAVRRGDIFVWFHIGKKSDKSFYKSGSTPKQENNMKKTVKEISTKTDADVRVRNEGNIWMVEPVSKEAKDWVNQNVNLEGWQWLGRSFAVDQHMIEDLMNGMEHEGLVIEESRLEKVGGLVGEAKFDKVIEESEETEHWAEFYAEPLVVKVLSYLDAATVREYRGGDGGGLLVFEVAEALAHFRHDWNSNEALYHEIGNLLHRHKATRIGDGDLDSEEHVIAKEIYDAMEEHRTELEQWARSPGADVEEGKQAQDEQTVDLSKPDGFRRYNELRAKGYTTVWRGEGKIRMVSGGKPYNPDVIKGIPAKPVGEANNGQSCSDCGTTDVYINTVWVKDDEDGLHQESLCTKCCDKAKAAGKEVSNGKPSETREAVGEQFELFYASGGHGGPFATVGEAETAARQFLAGRPDEAYVEIRKASDFKTVVQMVRREGVGEAVTPGADDKLSVIARGMSDKTAADALAAQRKGKVVTDKDDPKKFMVVAESALPPSGIPGCTCTECPKCHKPFVCEKCKRCIDCDGGHSEGCEGCRPSATDGATVKEARCDKDVEQLAQMIADGKKAEAESLAQQIIAREKLKDYEVVMMVDKVKKRVAELGKKDNTSADEKGAKPETFWSDELGKKVTVPEGR